MIFQTCTGAKGFRKWLITMAGAICLREHQDRKWRGLFFRDGAKYFKYFLRPKKRERPFFVNNSSRANGTSHCYKPFSEALGSCARLKYHKIDVGEKFLVRKLLWMEGVPFQISKKRNKWAQNKTQNLKWPPFRHFWSDIDPLYIKIFRRASTFR